MRIFRPKLLCKYAETCGRHREVVPHYNNIKIAKTYSDNIKKTRKRGRKKAYLVRLFRIVNP